MSNVNVNYEEMRNAAGQLRNGQENLNSTLSELSTLINGLVESGFVTDLASVTYQDQYQQFTAGTRTAIDALEGLAAYLEQAADVLAATDSDLSNAIRGCSAGAALTGGARPTVPRPLPGGSHANHRSAPAEPRFPAVRNRMARYR